MGSPGRIFRKTAPRDFIEKPCRSGDTSGVLEGQQKLGSLIWWLKRPKALKFDVLIAHALYGPFWTNLAGPDLFFWEQCAIFPQMTRTLSLRRASTNDLAAVDRLLGRSYPRLLAADYPPSTLVLAVPRLVRAKPELLASGRYFVAEDGEGRLLAAGGWSRSHSVGAGIVEDMGHVRHVATDPAVVRQGIGRALMERVLQDARSAGMQWLDCLSTRTAVPFYRALGFRPMHGVDVPLAAGIIFPAIRMLADLRQTSV